MKEAHTSMTANPSDLASKLASHQDEERIVEMASDMIEIPSPTGAEGKMADYLARRFAELGMSVELQEVEAGRNNVIARLRGKRSGPTLMFLGHLDTSTRPDDDLPLGFRAKAHISDGWLYGLGISNMKCAFAGYYSALQMLRDANLDFPGEIMVAGVVGEIEKAPIDEWQGASYRGGGAGARYLLNHGVTADFCINGEPTGLRLQTGNAGYIFARIHLTGSPQATFSRAAAIDPIPQAFRVHAALQEWEREYQEKHSDPHMKPLVSVGAIYGGYPFKPGLTAAFCNLYVHLTTIPGQSIRGVKEELEDLIASLRVEDSTLDATVEFYLASNGHKLRDDHPGAQAVASAHSLVWGGKKVVLPTPERYSISSDNSPLAEFGIPGITYGAGGINRSGDYNAYEPGIGEVVSIENLSACSRVYALAALQILESGERQ